MRALLLSLLLAGCAPPNYEPEIVEVYVEDTASAVAPDTSPSIEFVSPSPEALIEGCGYVIFRVANFTLVDPSIMGDAAEGFGHVHLYYPLATTSGELANDRGYELCANNYCLLDPAAEHTVFGAGGLVTIEAQLMQNTHQALKVDEQIVSATLEVKYVEGACELAADTGVTY